MLSLRRLTGMLLIAAIAFSCGQKQHFDTIITNGVIYDGSGGEPVKADLGIINDTVAAIGDLSKADATERIDAKGHAVAPGFINMMGHSEESLLIDGRGQSDVRQGVTTEIFCETSFAPLTDALAKQMEGSQADFKYKVDWRTMGEYMNGIVKKGISPNIASFVGAGTVRTYVLGEDNKAPTPVQLDSMKALVARAMQDGALGVTCALIYPPDNFASTEELIELCKEASKYGGTYSSHMRSEGNKFTQAVAELLRIAREAKIPAEIHHLKAGGKNNWNKMDSVIAMVEAAKKEGLEVDADMYTYLAGATGLTSAFPPTLQDGGFGKLRERLMDPKVRAQMKKEMNSDAQTWENLYYGAGGADHVLLLGFKQDSLKKYIGKTVGEVAKLRNQTPEDCAMDLIIQDSTRVGVAYFLMSEENVRKQAGLHWVSFGSDEGSYTTEGVFLKSNAHPRAYGNFARFLGKYVREDKVCSLQEAIYKLAKLPADHLRLKGRGMLKPGYFADVVIFDPETITDHSTFEKPHQYSTGVSDVWVNGKQVLKNSEPTDARPGRFVTGPGFGKKL